MWQICFPTKVERQESDVFCKRKSITGELFSLGLQGGLRNGTHADRQPGYKEDFTIARTFAL